MIQYHVAKASHSARSGVHLIQVSVVQTPANSFFDTSEVVQGNFLRMSRGERFIEGNVLTLGLHPRRLERREKELQPSRDVVARRRRIY